VGEVVAKRALWTQRECACSAVDRVRLDQRFAAGVARGGCGSRADAELAGTAAVGVHGGEHDRNIVDRAQVDGRMAKARGREVVALERLELTIAAPAQPRQGEPGGPRDHERVSLDELEEGRGQRLELVE